MNKIIAEDGKIYRRIHDGFLFGKEIILGYDYSTGIKRQDRAEYYEQIDKPEGWKEE